MKPLLLEDGGMAKQVRSGLRRAVYRQQGQTGKKLTQETIAKETGLSQPTVSAWMDDERVIDKLDIRAWLALADFMGVDPCDLLIIKDLTSLE